MQVYHVELSEGSSETKEEAQGMKRISLLNHVLGPVMRGPSSSHTAGSYHIGRMLRDLFGETPREARFSFGVKGSYGVCYHHQASDRAFLAGLLGWDLLDRRFAEALDRAPGEGLDASFEVVPLPGEDLHPNEVAFRLRGPGGELSGRARSVGGGMVRVTELQGYPADLNGEDHVLLAAGPEGAVRAALEGVAPRLRVVPGERGVLGIAEAPEPWPQAVLADLAGRAARGELAWVRTCRPLQFPLKGAPLAESAEDLLRLAKERDGRLASAALAHEASLLGLSEEALLKEMTRRLGIFREAVRRGLEGDLSGKLQLLPPYAGTLEAARREGRAPTGGIGLSAAIRAMAAMHACGALEVVCAAPTGGAAGALPGVFIALEEERGLSEEVLARGLFAAAAVGLVLAARGTFAAEEAGCQVEIGAAGAMAAAGVVEVFGGTALQALDAGAIGFQNTMGSVCDPVGGMVEIPCHTRNAALAASAFVLADLVLAGCPNPIPLDETVDAVMDVGRRLPPELRCTALGGLALCPSAVRLAGR